MHVVITYNTYWCVIEMGGGAEGETNETTGRRDEDAIPEGTGNL